MVTTAHDRVDTPVAVQPGRYLHAGMSTRSRLWAHGARLGVAPIVRAWMAAPEIAWPLGWVDAAAALRPRPRGVTVRETDLPNCRAEWVRAGAAGTGHAILYLHGGAFLTCGLNTHRALVAALSAAADAPVLSVGYRMLPRHPVGSAVEDAIDGYRHLLDIGYRGDDIVVAGDSAGGYLAFMTALSLARLDLPAAAGVAAISPLTSVAARSGRPRDAAALPLFPARARQAFARYLTRVHRRITVDGEPGPLMSPLDEDVGKLPPVLIHAGADELLSEDAELMAARLWESGVPCELHLWEGQVHAFPVVMGATSESRDAVDSVGRFVRAATGAEPVGRHRRCQSA